MISLCLLKIVNYHGNNVRWQAYMYYQETVNNRIWGNYILC